MCPWITLTLQCILYTSRQNSQNTSLWISSIAAMLFHSMLVNVCLVELCERDNEQSQSGRSAQQKVWTAVLPTNNSDYSPCCLLYTTRQFVCLNIAFPGSEVNQGPSSLLEQQARVQEVTPLIKTTNNNQHRATKTISSKSQTLSHED